MQDSKIDVGGDLEFDDTQQLPWSIKKLVLWLVLYLVISVGSGAPFGFLMAHFNHVNEWGLTVQDIVLIGHTYLNLVFILAFIAFLIWQCKKVDLSLRTIWGSYAPQVQYIIFALTYGFLMSLLWNWKVVNFDNIPAKYPDEIFYGYVIVMGLFGPFIEELYFRGMLYRTLCKRYVERNAILISAVIFAAYHFQYWLEITNLLFAFLFGVVTAFLVRRTNSLTASFVFHAIANLVHVVVFQYREFFLL